MLALTGMSKDGIELKASSHYTGWLLDCAEALEPARFPVSYNMLAALWAFSSVIGRRVAINRGLYHIWPPTSVLLLGSSGVGKSTTLLAVLDYIIKPITENRPDFFARHQSTSTNVGFIIPWIKHQEATGAETVEGAYCFDELSALLTPRTGNEGVLAFLIACLNHRDFQDSVKDGERLVKGITVTLGLATAVDSLRGIVRGRNFAEGGFLPRMLVAHELWRPRAGDKEGNDEVDPKDLDPLAKRLAKMYENLPDKITFSEAANRLCWQERKIREDEPCTISALQGWWHRVHEIIAKLGALFALSEGLETVEKRHVESAKLFIDRHLEPPLSEIVDELSHGPHVQKMYELADDLNVSRWKGIAETHILRKFGLKIDEGTARVEYMKRMGLAVGGLNAKQEAWLWRTEAYRAEYWDRKNLGPKGDA